MMNTTLEQATREYVALRDRRKNPTGTFDKRGRFYLAARFECCDYIRRPSRAWPYSEMLHGRTAEHVARQYNVEPKAIRRAARQS